jgi:adenosylmethionine-8-amino-7-oxononanoate aminotransferase
MIAPGCTHHLTLTISLSDNVHTKTVRIISQMTGHVILEASSPRWGATIGFLREQLGDALAEELDRIITGDRK